MRMRRVRLRATPVEGKREAYAGLTPSLGTFWFWKRRGKVKKREAAALSTHLGSGHEYPA